MRVKISGSIIMGLSRRIESLDYSSCEGSMQG